MGPELQGDDMQSSPDVIRFQAEEHPLVPTSEFASLEDYVLYLIHRVAYEEAAKFAAQKTVLDLGCNNGYGTAILGRESTRTVGVDVSPQSVEAAQRNNAAQNIEYRVVDGFALPFEDATFDLAVSFQVIEHIFDVAPYLRNIRRVLKPGGTAIFTTPNAPIRLDPGMKPWNEFHVREFSAAELQELLAPWFSSVVVKGLFAEQSLYDTEYQRVQRSKRNAKLKEQLQRQTSWKLKRKIIDTAKAVLPRTLIERSRKLLQPTAQAAATRKPLEPEILSRYSTADFAYRTSDLDRSLDLMAVCQLWSDS